MAIEESATSDDQWADADDDGFGDSGSSVAVETQASPDTETTTPDVEETPSDLRLVLAVFREVSSGLSEEPDGSALDGMSAGGQLAS